ncbi:M48 family metallopeptidase [Actinoplanes sp. NEAU-A12]|uniref:M48 family metallopeptidase n=1 Tax=Actinoplanes sandaracinus TaxID=3045177 RepID=A0ABT6WQE6_9ACTN|nr:M48 family metallopeptidase [Actinoplanes sandaracinus]MDI6101955.1 M48 family metallopeptidase [Actinoplanes sandaracinus]
MSKGAPASAARSAAGLAGFLVVAGLQLAAVLLALWAVLWLLPSGFALRAGAPLSLATFGTLGYATWRALHTRHRIPAGVAVGRAQAPKLWELVDGAASAAGVAVPDGVTVVADATAALGERTRLLGLIGGRRDLYLGLPLLQVMEPDRLKAVVAHELAHSSTGLGRWAPLAYRGRVAVGRTVPRISPRNPAGAVLRAYARFYRRLDAPFSRAQELAADRIAASHAGAEATAAALRDLPALAGMQRLFHAEYVGPGWQAGYMPDDVFGGLLRVLAARTTEMTMLRAREPEPPGPWDTHPSLAERVAAVQALPASAEDTGPAKEDTSPAKEDTGPAKEDTGPAEGTASDPPPELVPDLPALGQALQAVAFPPRGRAVVSWDECLSVARTSEMEREAEAALAAISRAAGSAVPNAGRLLSLVADGRLRAAAESVFPDAPPEEATARIVELLGLMLALAALRSGVARWRHSWTGAAEVVAVDGTYLNLAELAAAAADPETTEAVRAYLTEAGVDLAAAASRPGSARAQVLGGLVNLSADGARTDLLITDLGLLLVPGLPRGRGAESKRRLTRIAADGVPAGGAAASPDPAPAPSPDVPPDPARDPADAPADGVSPDGGRFVPFVDVAGLTTLPGRRKGWVIGMRGGAELTLKPALDTDELPGGWAAWDEAVTFLAGTR